MGRDEETETQTHRKEDHIMMEAATNQRIPGVFSNQKILGRDKERFFPRIFRESTWFQTSGLQNSEEEISVALSYSDGWFLLLKPQEAKAA